MLKNSRLEKLFTLNHKLTIYVPSTKNVTEHFDNTKEVEKTAEMLSKFFGGATSSPALGFWVSETEGLVREKTTLVFAYCAEADLAEHIDEVIDYCENLKKELEQEAVAFELDGTMCFV